MNAQAMNEEEHRDDPIELGRASVETKGGPLGYEDQERTLWMHGVCLTDD